MTSSKALKVLDQPSYILLSVLTHWSYYLYFHASGYALANQAHLDASAYALAFKTYLDASAMHWHFITHRLSFDLIALIKSHRKFQRYKSYGKCMEFIKSTRKYRLSFVLIAFMKSHWKNSTKVMEITDLQSAWFSLRLKTIDTISKIDCTSTFYWYKEIELCL